MPELPEVEIVARSLDRLVKRKRIGTAELLRERLAPDSPPKKFAKALRDTGINFVHRRGKHILFDLDNGKTLITHLRMSGRFMLLSPESEDPKFTHAVFYLDDETRLVFQDQRHFGLMKIVETARLYEAKELASLAPEPFSNDFSAKYLFETLRGSKRSIKEFLIDQTKVCGIGNIYASEALFLSGINPIKTANKITSPKAATLHAQIRGVLGEAIELGKTQKIDRENIGGSIYGNGVPVEWRVYDREGEPCINCETVIVRLKQGGRSTYYCRHCQRM
jgi:formamidopyrimidine-DNA glycosylase